MCLKVQTGQGIGILLIGVIGVIGVIGAPVLTNVVSVCRALPENQYAHSTTSSLSFTILFQHANTNHGMQQDELTVISVVFAHMTHKHEHLRPPPPTGVTTRVHPVSSRRQQADHRGGFISHYGRKPQSKSGAERGQHLDAFFPS